MEISRSDVQLFLRPGIVEFVWGHPDMALLPVDGLLQAAQVALERDGPLALSYGAEQGPMCLIEQVCARLDRLEGTAPFHQNGGMPPHRNGRMPPHRNGRMPPHRNGRMLPHRNGGMSPEQMMITGGTSQALDMLCTVLTQPSDAVLVESPVYHLALRIFRDHGLELVPVASDDEGLRVDALEEALTSLQRQGRRVCWLYTVPTFNNPTGLTLKEERRRVLVALAQRAGLTVLEDDAYYELWYDSPPPPPLCSLAPVGPVVRLGSFSKVLAPGLRLGWMLATPEIVRRCAGSGMLDSGGGVNHFTAHVVAAFIELGLLDEQVETLRASYRQRRDVLLDGLASHLPEGCEWVCPGGGFFVWLRLPPGVDSGALLPIAESAGVSYVPGARFYAGGGGERYCRLAFTLVSLEELGEGARRLASALRDYQQ